MTNKYILIVDDEEDILEIVQLCFEAVAGWKVSTAQSGSEGLIYAESEQPDAILLDMMMPDMNGLHTLVKLRDNKLTKDIPVIFLTAKDNLLDTNRLTQLKVTGIISKPFEPMTLANQVEKLLSLS